MERVPVQPLDYPTVFSGYLDPGEPILWSGQPWQGVFLRASDAMAIPFSLLWGGFAIVWEIMALRDTHGGKNMSPFARVFFPMWGIPFVGVGLYIMFGRFFVDVWRRRRTWYAVTDRRAIIVRTGPGRTVSSFELRSIGEVSFQEHADGTGTLTFGPAATVTRHRSFRFPEAVTNAFEHTPDAAQAYRIVRQVQQSLTTAGP